MSTPDLNTGDLMSWVAYLNSQRGTWRLAADDETMVWIPEGADSRTEERKVRGTALQRWQDGQAANEAFGPGGAW